MSCLALPAGVPANEGYQAEPYRQEAEAFDYLSIDVKAVPRTTVAQLCGDKDGCTVRFVGYYMEGLRAEAKQFLERHLSTDPAGIIWRVYAADVALTSGKTDNGLDEELAGFPLLGHVCVLRDDSASNSYRLVAASQDTRGWPLCILRIFD